MVACCIPHQARAHSSGEAEYSAAVSATSEAMVIREVSLFMGLEVRIELLLNSAAARGICRREGVGTIRRLSMKVLWLQQLVKRGIVMVSACTSAENRADLGTKSLPIHRLRQLRQLNGLALNGTDTSANGDGRMDRTRLGSQELLRKQSPILDKVVEESWKHKRI